MLQFDVLASILLSDPIPPNDPIPHDLQGCIEDAGLCVSELGFPSCNEKWALGAPDCLEAYEDCTYPFPEAHEPNCMVALGWCLVEWCTSPDEYRKWCVEVAEVCGDFATPPL